MARREMHIDEFRSPQSVKIVPQANVLKGKLETPSYNEQEEKQRQFLKELDPEYYKRKKFYDWQDSGGSTFYPD